MLTPFSMTNGRRSVALCPAALAMAVADPAASRAPKPCIWYISASRAFRVSAEVASPVASTV
jgi:hypothetical protein